MDLAIQSLGIPDGIAGWQILQKTTDTDFKQFTNDPVLKADIAYFQKNAPKATTAAKLLADPRLANVALTAYGLSAQAGSTALMTKVLNSNTADRTSFANKLASPAYAAMAKAFGYGNAPTTAAVAATASSATVNVEGLDGSNGFDTFSGTFGGVTLGNIDLSGATSRAAMAAALQAAFQKADGGSSAITVSVSGLDLVFKDANGRGTASGFAWSATTDGQNSTATGAAPTGLAAGSPAVPPGGAVASAATVGLGTLNGNGTSFNSFSGTFGGVSVKNVSLIGAASNADVATALQAAFQKADGGDSDITVAATATGITLSDAKGRGTAAQFTWAAGSGGGVAAAPSNLAAGRQAQPVTGGALVNPTPAVASQAFLGLDNLDGADGFSSFTGTFGGVALSGVDLSGATTRQAIASKLQAAFQKADGGRSDITVAVSGLSLRFSDAKGRGMLTGFSMPADGATASAASVALSAPDAGGDSFSGFSGTFGGIGVSNVALGGARSYADVAAALQTAFRQADGGNSDITVQATSTGVSFSDAKGRGTAQNFAWSAGSGGGTAAAPSGEVAGQTAASTGDTATHGNPFNMQAGHPVLPAVPGTASAANVALGPLNSNGLSFLSFNGTFGGISVKNVSLVGATGNAGVAAALQAAFRQADGGSTSITVSATASGISFQDAGGRGTAKNFSWTAGLGHGSAAAANGLVAGTPAQMTAGGPNVANAAFISTVVGKYTEAQFQAVVGGTSNTLRTALYAQQTLPTVSNWYSVIADPNLATVVETALGLPSSFPQIDVDRQAAILGSKMNIKDLQNPAKLKTLLNQYVAIGTAQENASSGLASPAETLLSGSGTSFSLSSGSAAALLLST